MKNASLTRLDTEFVRAQFPAFAEPELQGWGFFENAGGSYACRQVIDRLSRYYRQTKVQPYYAYPASERAGAEMDAARAGLARLLNVGVDEMHIGPSTSQNTYVLAQAFRAGMKPGDEVIVTTVDHEANSGAWRRLADSGVVVREWAADPDTGMLTAAGLRALLTDRTRLVAFSHCSNIIGAPHDVPGFCALIRAAGAVSVVDGVSYAPHGLPDVAALGADIYLFSLYKVYGPHQGAMVVRAPVMTTLANQSHYFNAGEVHKRLVPAGPDHAQVAATLGVVEYFDTLAAHHGVSMRGLHDLIREHEVVTLAPLLDFLRSRNDCRVLGPSDAAQKAPTVAVVTPRDPQTMVPRLAQHRIMAGWGNFYAPRILKQLGVDPERGVLRLSFVHYTTADEVAALIGALEKTL